MSCKLEVRFWAEAIKRLHERRDTKENTKRLTQVGQASHRSLFALSGTASPRKQMQYKTENHIPLLLSRVTGRLFVALSGRVRPVVIMPQMALPVNSKRSDMQGFHLPLDQYPAFLPQDADTAHPRTPIPIYYFHSLSEPFCQNVACACQSSKREAARLLGVISEGNLLLQEAAALIDAGICQFFGHSWEITEHPDVKECSLCHIRGYCPGCTPIAPQNAQPFFCTAHTLQQRT